VHERRLRRKAGHGAHVAAQRIDEPRDALRQPDPACKEGVWEGVMLAGRPQRHGLISGGLEREFQPMEL